MNNDRHINPSRKRFTVIDDSMEENILAHRDAAYGFIATLIDDRWKRDELNITELTDSIDNPGQLLAWEWALYMVDFKGDAFYARVRMRELGIIGARNRKRPKKPKHSHVRGSRLILF